MGKLLNELTKQLKTEHKKEAEECFEIYNYLEKKNNGRIWDSEWNVLIHTTYKGVYPNSIRTSKPSDIGKIFLKGLLK